MKYPEWISYWIAGKSPLSVTPTEALIAAPDEVIVVEKGEAWRIKWPDSGTARRELSDYQQHRTEYLACRS